MKKCLLLLLFISTTISAQLKVTGKVTNSWNEPIVFAEIKLVMKDSVHILSELTTEEGIFILKTEAGSYNIQIIVSNKILFSKIIEINGDLDMGTITIENLNQLKSVGVMNKKKLVERKVDRLVYNVENSISASGGDALDAISVTPGVRVENDKISIIGKSTVAVMINEKIVQLSEDNLSNYLKSIPSDNIKSIEVITTPPAKYEAAGNSGLINIILKKTKKNSWNSLIGATYLQRKYSDGLLFGNFNYNKNKLSIYSSGNYRDGRKYVNEDIYDSYPDELWHTKSTNEIRNTLFNINLGVDYKITSKWSFGGQFLINKNRKGFDDITFADITDYAENKTIQYLQSAGTPVQNPNIKSLNFYNEFKIDTLGRKITLNVDLFNFNDEGGQNYNGISVIESPYSKKYFAGVNNNNQDIKNVSVKLDIDCPVKWAALSFGGKISNSKVENEISSFNSGLADNPIMEMPLIENDFDYTENVQGLYFSGNKKINKQWEAQFGLRMEMTQTSIFSASLDQSVKDNYAKFFPTAYLSYKLSDNSTFGLNYSKRIERPSFIELNPNVYYFNPYKSIQGNPNLQPAFINNFELTYTYKTLESKVYISHEENLFSEIPIITPGDNMIRTTFLNYIDSNRYGIAENYIYNKLKCWTSNNSVDLNYSVSKSNLAITENAQKGFNCRISTDNDFLLNASKTLLLNLRYWYSFPGTDGIYTVKSTNSLSIAMQYFLLNKDLKISLKGNDLFRTQKYKRNITVNGVNQAESYYFDAQSVQLSVSYSFGNKNIEIKKRDKGNDEESERTGI